MSKEKVVDKINVRKKSASGIFYGVNPLTGEILNINDVKRGKSCNCVCAVCNQPLEARKGKINIHHFAHVNNYDCCYSSEIAIYMLAAKILGDTMGMMLPQIGITFPSWNGRIETVCNQRYMRLDDTPTYKCEDDQYPPELIVKIKEKPIRIVLNFGKYYEIDDIVSIMEYEKRRGNACIMYTVPHCENFDFFSTDHLKTVLEEGISAAWVYSPLAEMTKMRFIKRANQLSQIDGYIDCTLHKDRIKSRYCVSPSTCRQCSFNISETGGILCLGEGAYEHINELSNDKEVQMKKAQSIRIENEKQIEEKAQKMRDLKRKYWMAGRVTDNVQSIGNAGNNISTSLPNDRYAELPIRIEKNMQCIVCGEYRTKGEMVMYGGVDGPNRGTCRFCYRKQQQKK